MENYNIDAMLVLVDVYWVLTDEKIHFLEDLRFQVPAKIRNKKKITALSLHKIPRLLYNRCSVINEIRNTE